ncbi:Ubiquitin carboxyl-terminal hydrolase 34 [Colletotrichum aenigma]|uniref:Ubiquitin carboxyl-terminal hydrolase 34 n=1 Tax=Colletotrichum aenigma TaxID=1215731 RepID=UPI001872624C|nr:Ubiquitin carboxyl-terminal hydrolase 34 [Colletotrichum aenigma]KAF5521773.1 Ubiquitin carboxyl-terminal hydrolase 34 [Colletotrichum aenigma]
MDQPTGSSEAPERAVSSEPSSTRPNPFTEDDDASRKRRRTSLSGGSRSRSAESPRSGLDTSSSPAADLLADDHNTQDSAMRIDTGPSTPQTPEMQSTARQPPTEPPSSRVTINLRNPAQPDLSSSSPVSPTRQSLPTQSAEPPDGVKKSVEDLEEEEVDMVQAPIEITDTPPSTSSSMSPEVEVIAIPDEEQDAPFDDEVSIIREDAGSLDPLDPTTDFPYHEALESLQDTATRLVNYLSPPNAPPDEAVLDSLRIWMISYIQYVTNVGVNAAYESHLAYHSFWHTFPEIAWVLSTKKLSASRDSGPIIADFFSAFSKLASFFIEFDYLTAEAFHDSPDADGRQPEYLIGRFVQPLLTYVRREEVRAHNATQADEEMHWTAGGSVTEMLDLFLSGSGDLKLLNTLTQMHLANAPRYQHIMDMLVPITNITALIVRKAARVIRHPQVTPQKFEMSKTRLADGHILCNMVTGALTTVIDKNVTQLSNENAQTLISALHEILKLSLGGDHNLATERLKLHRQSYPELPAKFTADAIAMEWKLGVLGKLITSSQMQLRVMAASTMCQDLVSLYKKNNDSEDDSKDYKEECSRFLKYIAEYLLRTKLVDYILGPTCHPEITVESGNIVGFLVVTHFYRKEQTDLLWQTITTTQDPRVSEALIRMATPLTTLFTKEELLYLCEKVHSMPLEAFTTSVRGLCTSMLKDLHLKFNLAKETPNILPLSFCIRLLREASVYSPESHITSPEVHQFAIDKFKDLVKDGLDPELRKELYNDCIRDIAAKSSTTLGTLWCLGMALRPAVAHELRVLTAEHNLTALLVDELDHAIEQAKRAGIPIVLCEHFNSPRRELISWILTHEPTTVTSDLGPRLWDMLVGHGAACQDDRGAGWAILNNLPKEGKSNPFRLVCFTEYLPNLPRDCLCEGALQFVKEAIVSRVNDINDIILDDDESLAQSGIEQLWRMVLDAENLALVDAAIQTLVVDVYIESESILAYPHHRARQVHLGLVNRCLKQMEAAAKRLESFNEGTRSGDDEPMVIVATEEQTREQERVFIRSLAVLRHFLRAHQTKAHFSAPDLRALTPGSPSVTEGESAELKFQSFDGNKQTDIMPLEVGRRNTAASLLASIRQATGFDNYRIYYRGRPFAPNENDVCRSLEELKIHDGLILVKRDENGTTAAARIKPGASLLEIEILGHFGQLWNYLSMQETLAREIHNFLVKLPADTHMIAAFDSPDTSYEQIFPLGQPFKSQYALYAMREYMDSAVRRLKEAVATSAPEQKSAITDAYLDALVRVRKLVVAAISDPDVIDSSGSEVLKNRLAFTLMNTYLLTLREPAPSGSSLKYKSVAIAPPGRLVDILSSAINGRHNETFVSLTAATFSAIIRSIAMDFAFWTAFETLPNLEDLLGTLLLDEPCDTIRVNIAKIIEDRIISPSESTPSTRSFCERLWPMLSRLIDRAVEKPRQCLQVFKLSHILLIKLCRDNPGVVNVPELARQCGDLLLSHDSAEHIEQFGPEDTVARGLANLLWYCLTSEMDLNVEQELPDKLGRKLFWKHLFPPPQRDGSRGRSCILSTATRLVLGDIVFYLVSRSEQRLHEMLIDLESLVPFDEFENDPYIYELQPQFDRMSAIRAPCGYAGLRNLSNTCYLNSLFTQLFMNTGFRKFMVDAVTDELQPQNLVAETQKLFAFMQGSARKFIDPSLLVGCIKTYDDTPIDVHNQMDVDEFYNLLFDRWEGQLNTVEEKQALRSFYGGQLVQQVASKECDHISERLEPFSAIQCDIKGKLNLQDSLQAYVDGEIMQGDNKYKCSSCDRHVDAVKRACLKDIPDNLIFHLKRFDFNLRTLMRSKINDYFSFPTKIDMRPYTIDHLGSPSDSGEEDMFELVGVLVHAGTAESGHYYSYIRERPTGASSEAWFEFNDDVVSPWNPADLEKSTFGGPEVPFDNGVSYDKTYSAYMLFYQRSSVLKAEQEEAQSLSLPMPLKVTLPKDVADHIAGENTILLRRHCLYDPSHSQLVLKTYDHARMRDGGLCSPMHLIEQRAMHMLLGHLDQVASRTKDLPYFEAFRRQIERACVNCVKCSLDFIEYFQERPESFRQLLQRNPDPGVRFAVGSLFITSLRTIKASQPEAYYVSEEDMVEEPVMAQVMQLFDTLWINFQTNIRSWSEVFQTILAFAKLGPAETALLLSEDWFMKILRIIIADANLEMPQQYMRMLTNVMRRMSNTRAIQYDMIIQLAEHFIGSLEGILDPSTIVDGPEVRWELYMEHQKKVGSPQRFPWTSSEVTHLLHELGKGSGSIFVKKLIELNQEHLFTAAIIRRLMNSGPEMESKVFSAIRTMISGQLVQYAVTPFIQAAMVFSEQSRSDNYVLSLFRHVAAECRSLQNSEGAAFLGFFKMAYSSLQNSSDENDESRHMVYIDFIPMWAPSLLGFFEPEVRRETEYFLSAWLSTHAPDDKEDKFSALVNMAARKLAMNCLYLLRENFLKRRAPIVKQHTESLQGIIVACEPYFQVDVAADADQRIITLTEFQEAFRSIIEPLRRMAVEEMDDEGSDWENSIASSEQLESLADVTMQTAGDLPDADLQ